MKVNINNSDFSNISTAVFYRWHKFIPAGGIFPSDQAALRESCTAGMVQYWGSKTYTTLRDFSEYDFSMFPEKIKFGDSLKIASLDIESRELIGKNLEDLEKVEAYMFPTLSVSDKDPEYGYFGSTLISSQTFILFDTPADYWKIELYEDIITSNNSGGGFVETEFLEVTGEDTEGNPKPFMTIILGPSADLLNNSDSLYYYYDPVLKERDRSIGAVDYVKLLQEISSPKVVWLLLTSNNDITDINLSYKSWNDSKNPNRNMWKYSIRNDEYWSTKDSIDILDKTPGTSFWYDMNSKTLLGNEEIPHNGCPLMKQREKYISATTYSPFVEYSLGDKVNYGQTISGEAQEWESLENGNIGNIPTFSHKWILSEAVKNTRTNRVTIMMNPTIAGSTTPGGTITVKRDDSRRFLITENVGYRLSQDAEGNLVPPSYDFTPESILSPDSYNFTTISESGIIRKYLYIYDWTKPIESGRLIINFDISKSTVTLTATDPEGLSPSGYSQWSEFFGEPSFGISAVITPDGIDAKPEIKDSKIELQPGRKTTLVIPELSKYTVSKAISTYYVGSSEVPETLELEISRSENNETLITGTIDFTAATLNIQLAYKIFQIFLSEYTGFEISKVLDEVQYGGESKFSFYTQPGIIFGKVVVTDSTDLSTEITLKDLGKTLTIGETTEFMLTRDSENIFTLLLKNPTTDYKIQIYDTK